VTSTSPRSLFLRTKMFFRLMQFFKQVQVLRHLWQNHLGIVSLRIWKLMV
jgi:hypothetical protein